MVNVTFAHRISECAFTMFAVGVNLNLLYICDIGKQEYCNFNFSCSVVLFEFKK